MTKQRSLTWRFHHDRNQRVIHRLGVDAYFELEQITAILFHFLQLVSLAVLVQIPAL